MSCVQPIPAVKDFHPTDSWVDDSGVSHSIPSRYSVRFNSRLGDEIIYLPCGRCVGCRASQSLTWAIRCYHELLTTPGMRASFVTLTYREPAPCDLDPDHLRLFWMRLRKRFGKLRYFACGERGDLTGRPHFHALIFGHDFLDGRVTHATGVNYHPELDSIWTHGFVDVGSVEFASILYVAGYCGKKIGDPDTFSRMSRKPPIGYDYFCKHVDDLRRLGFCVIEGQKFPIPARYFDWGECDPLQDVKDDRRLSFAGVEPDYRELKAKAVSYHQSRKNRSEKI